VQARKTLWRAEQARKIGDPPQAIRLYKDGLEQWKQVLINTKDFHRPDRSDRTEEETFEYELAYMRLLVQDDVRVRQRANEVARATAAVVPHLAVPFPPGAGQSGPDPLWSNANREEIKWYVVENVAGADFSSPFVGSLAPDGGPWVNEALKESVRVKQGVSRKPQAPAPSGPPPTPPPAGMP
jgi:hypothetical protein